MNRNNADRSKENENQLTALEWIDLQKNIDAFDTDSKETFIQKAKRRTIENPIAPIGERKMFQIANSI